jgi:hypothetical protein
MSTTTFQKRQKEMKRLEKQKMKAERRANRKTTKGEGEPQEEELTVMTGPKPLDFDLRQLDKQLSEQFDPKPGSDIS